jgi:hypothetical protein
MNYLTGVPRTITGLGAIPSYFPRKRTGTSEIEIYYGESIPQFLSGQYDPCYSVVQHSQNQKKAEHSDPAFNAVRKIVESAHGAVLPELNTESYIRSIPLIVIDFDLFICSMNVDTDINVEPTERASVAHIDEVTNQSTEVHIITERALPQFLIEIEEMSRIFGAHPDFSDHGA